MKPAALAAIGLPKPSFKGGKTVLKSLQARRTTRSIGPRKLPLQVLSNLLWSAFGVNRKQGPFGTPGRTAASASHSQEIGIYATLANGIYRYECAPHRLVPVLAGDHRPLAIGKGQGKLGSTAPLRLIYVADLAQFAKAGFQEPGLWDPDTQKAYYFVDTGMVAANVYLFAASQGLGAWFHNCDKAALTKLLKLGPKQRVLFGQTVGYPDRIKAA